MTVTPLRYDQGVPTGGIPFHLRHVPHWVYRCFDAEGVLLYVGCTMHPEERQVEHRRSSPWFADVVNVELVGPFVGENARKRALDAEEAMICSDRPLHVMPTGMKRRERREQAHLVGERCDQYACRLCRERFQETFLPARLRR